MTILARGFTTAATPVCGAGSTEAPPPAEGDNVGTGNSSDFIDVPVSDGSEKATAESKKVEDDDNGNVKKDDKKADRKPTADTVKKKKKFFERIFGRKNN